MNYVHLWLLVLATAALSTSPLAGELRVTGIKAEHRNGQTFITWMDVASGEAGAGFRYTIYRSDVAITQENLDTAQKRVWNILNNSAKLYSQTFNGRKEVDRLDPKRANCIIREGDKPLPEGSGLIVITPDKAGKAFYAVVATDLGGRPLSKVVPGESATTQPVAEQPAAIQPIKQWDSKSKHEKKNAASGQRGLPLVLDLHASGGYARTSIYPYGDYYLFFGPRQWGWQEGLPGVFVVDERREPDPDNWGASGRDHRLVLQPTDAIIAPNGIMPMETGWLGYYCVPQWASHKDQRVYLFTEQRLEWMLRWAVDYYGADPNRIYCTGGSMGARGTWSFAMVRPGIFAAIYPNRGGVSGEKAGVNALSPGNEQAEKVIKYDGKPILMADGKTDYWPWRNRIQYALDHHEDLPFIGWCVGRHDGFSTWKEHYDLAKALAASRHGFAFAWNNGDHGGAVPLMGRHITKWYPMERFRRNLSYPAFSSSSIDNDLGDGSDAGGDLEGGINLGFAWTDPEETAGKWSVKLSNSLCKAEMTVDVTPRRCQAFKPRPGERFRWTASSGGSGEVAADQWGLVTIEKVKILPGAETLLKISR